MRGLAAGVVALIIACGVVMSARALELPAPPTTRVNDYAGILDASVSQQLDAELARFEQETSNQIVVAVFPSLEEESLEDYVVRLFDKWNLGQKGRSNGVLLAVFMAEKKIRIEVGYGLEGVLTDALTSRIIRNEMAPQFQAGHPDQGIVAAVTAIEQASKGEYQGLPRKRRARGNDFVEVWGPFLFIMLLAVVAPILSTLRRRGPVVVGPNGRRRNRSNDWWGSGGGLGGGWGGGIGGGFGGGGGGWGGGGGGGGFSGGGGSSGGGGASGGW